MLQYRNPWGRMRIGRVLEDLDSMAGNIAFAHSDDGSPETVPPLLVTAAVERIELLRPLELSSDATLSAPPLAPHLS
jgi:acyl-coenzyme A thioesterase 9